MATVGIFARCVQAATGHRAAAEPAKVSKSRLLTVWMAPPCKRLRTARRSGRLQSCVSGPLMQSGGLLALMGTAHRRLHLTLSAKGWRHHPDLWLDYPLPPGPRLI